MRTFPLVISSPDGEVFRGAVVQISVRGIEGSLAILAGHAPFVTSVKPCDCEIQLSDGETRTGSTNGGILAVSKDMVTLTTGTFAWV